MYLSDHTPAMKPSDAFAHIARRTTRRVPIDELEGRITTSLVTPYPPGIPLLIPGEAFNTKIVEYLKFNRAFALECPGFENDIHGLVQEVDADGVVRHFADCVAALAARRAVRATRAAPPLPHPQFADRRVAIPAAAID